MVNPIELEIFYQEICTKALVLVKSDLLVKKPPTHFTRRNLVKKHSIICFVCLPKAIISLQPGAVFSLMNFVVCQTVHSVSVSFLFCKA